MPKLSPPYTEREREGGTAGREGMERVLVSGREGGKRKEAETRGTERKGKEGREVRERREGRERKEGWREEESKGGREEGEGEGEGEREVGKKEKREGGREDDRWEHIHIREGSIEHVLGKHNLLFSDVTEVPAMLSFAVFTVYIGLHSGPRKEKPPK